MRSEEPLTYSELIKRGTLLSRFRYAVLGGDVGVATFGFDRHLNQKFYHHPEWKRTRDIVILRDNGNDLGLEDHPIMEKVIVHHMNPLRAEDIVHWDEDRLFNPEYLVCVSPSTHNAIHFGDENQLPQPIIERRPGDTWF